MTTATPMTKYEADFGGYELLALAAKTKGTYEFAEQALPVVEWSSTDDRLSLIYTPFLGEWDLSFMDDVARTTRTYTYKNTDKLMRHILKWEQKHMS